MAEATRRRRWDAGTVVITPRDEATLATIGEHLWVRQVDLQQLLGGVSDSAVRGWLDRMARAGMVRRERRAGAGWVALTTAGMRAIDLDYEHRPLSTWVADHATTTLRLRLALQAAYPGSEWRSERYWRRRQAQLGKGGHLRVPDGSLLLPSGTHAAVEVETSRKAPGRLARIAREYANDVDVAWWFTTPELLDWLHRTWRETSRPARPAIEVLPLPEGSGREPPRAPRAATFGAERVPARRGAHGAGVPVRAARLGVGELGQGPLRPLGPPRSGRGERRHRRRRRQGPRRRVR
jgi:hypothetical protein